MNIMYIGHFRILHVVDAATNFSAARFLPDLSTTTVWATFTECWASVYTWLQAVSESIVDHDLLIISLQSQKSADINLPRSGLRYKQVQSMDGGRLPGLPTV